MDNNQSVKHLDIKLGDELLEISTNRLAWVHKTNVFGSKNTFYIKYLDNAKEQIVTHRNHSKYKKTGNNINDDSDDDSDSF